MDRSKIPEVRPAVEGLFTDDDGRLWVQAVTASDSVRTFDAFDTVTGDYLGTLVTEIPVESTPAPVIRGETLWAVVRDELDVAYVIRGRMVPVVPER